MQRKIRRQIQRRLQQKAAKALWTSVAAAGLLIGACGYSLANPADGTVTAGNGTISANGSTATVTQTSDKLAIDWQSFNIAFGETVNFVQPSSSAIALNRVIGTDASAIYGTLSANGKVFLINPNGILFSPTAQVNVGGLVASTLNISDNDFISGNYIFSGNCNATVVNQGTIAADDGGYVVLLGSQTSNDGVIVARQGTVALGAGSRITLDFYGDGLLNLAVDQGALGALADNRKMIQADGGRVIMTAQTADALAGTVVNNSGIIQAQSISEINGEIVLSGGTNGTVAISGTLDASGFGHGETGGTVKVLGNTVMLDGGTQVDVSGDAGGGTVLIGGNYRGGGNEQRAAYTTVAAGATINADAMATGNGGQVIVWADDTVTFAGTISARGGSTSGNGGSIETSGHYRLTVDDAAIVNTLAANGVTGTWLLDPADFTIAASGGDMTGTALSNALSTNNVTIFSGSGTVNPIGEGNIYLNDSISWSANNTKLTLSADKNIYINANISATGTGAGLVLAPGPSSSYSLGSSVQITLSGENATFRLGGIDYTVINDHSTGGALQALQNIGTDNTALSGKYVLGINIDADDTITWNDGAGFTPIGRSGSNRFNGTFDGLGHTIGNLYINRTDTDYVGLFGYSTGTIRNVALVNGSGYSISGKNNVGGLVGWSEYGTIFNCSSTGDVSGGSNIGGLMGANTNGNISYCSSSATVSGASEVGGLVGYNYTFSSADRRGSSSVNYSINNSYSTGNVAGGSNIGGLVGYNYTSSSSTTSAGATSYSNTTSSITNSYSSSAVTGAGNNVGGLVGYNYSNSYSYADSGGIASSNATSSITNSYSTGTVTGSGNNVGGLVGSNSRTNSSSSSSGGSASPNANSNISGSYSTGGVTSALTSDYVGGLIGYNSGKVSDCSLTDVTIIGHDNLGGLIGYNSGTISNCAIGILTMTGHDNLGGLVGSNSGAISNCSINSVTVSGNSNLGGLVGLSNLGSIQDSFSGNGTITGDSDNIGGLVGKNSGTISNSHSTSNVTGAGSYVGGLMGSNSNTISDSYSTGEVNSTSTGNYVGGLIGNNSGAINNSHSTSKVAGAGNYVGGLIGSNSNTINNSYSTGEVMGNGRYIGGLAGANTNAAINDCYSSSMVNGASEVGGLVGYNYSYSSCSGSAGRIVYSSATSSISNSYSTGEVNGSGNNVGGLVGYNYSYSYSSADSGATASSNSTSSISNSYSTGKVNGGNNVGGLVGYNTISRSSSSSSGGNASSNASSSINNCYSTGVVTGSSAVGGLLGNDNGGSIANCYWLNTAATTGVGLGSETNITALTAAEMKHSGNYTGWDIATAGGGDTIWRIYEGYSNPLLASFLTDLTVSADSVTKTYDGSAYIGAPSGVSYSTASNSTAVSPAGVSGTLTYGNGSGAGTYSLSGLYCTSQQGYDISYSPTSTLTIDKAQLTVSLTGTITKTYDGTTAATLSESNYSLSGVIGRDAVFLDYATNGNFDTKNAGSGKTVTVNGLRLSGADAANYMVNESANANIGVIDKASLTVNLTGTVTKTYDGTTAATLTGSNYTFSGLVDGDNVSVANTTVSYDTKNVGSGKTVTVNGISLNGADAANYMVNETTNANIGVIDKASLTVDLTGTVTKTYDGTTAAALSGSNYSLSGVIGSDAVFLDYATNGNFDTKNAGSGKTVTVNGLSLSGADATNYMVNESANANIGVIDKASLTVNLTGTVTKTYDGTTAAAISGSNYSLSGVIGNDAVFLDNATNGNFDTKNAGSGKTVTVNGLSLSGADAANYTFNDRASGNIGEIGKATMTITANNSAKLKGTLNPDFSATYTGLVEGDTPFSLNGALSFNCPADASSPIGKYAITPFGVDSSNYDIQFIDGTLTVVPIIPTMVGISGNPSQDGEESSYKLWTIVGDGINTGNSDDR